VQGDPRCAELAKAKPPYAKASPGARGCLAPHGALTSRGIGGLALGDTETRARSLFGAPHLIRRGFLRWCYQDGTSLRAGLAADRSGDFGNGDADPTLVVLATNRAFRARGVGPGVTLRALRRKFPGARRRFAANGKAAWTLSRRGRLVAGVRHGRVAYLAVYDRTRIRTLAALKAYLRRGG
jgi:hypothetical protein